MLLTGDFIWILLFWVLAGIGSSAALAFFLHGFPPPHIARKKKQVFLASHILVLTVLVSLWSANLRDLWLYIYFCITISSITLFGIGGIISHVLLFTQKHMFLHQIRRYREYRILTLIILSLIPGLFWTLHPNWTTVVVYFFNSVLLGAAIPFLWSDVPTKRHLTLLLTCLGAGEFMGLGISGSLRAMSTQDLEALIWAVRYFCIRGALAYVAFHLTYSFMKRVHTRVFYDFNVK